MDATGAREAFVALLPHAERAVVLFVLAIASGAHGFIDVMLFAANGGIVTGVSTFSSAVWPVAYLSVAGLCTLHYIAVYRGFAVAPWIVAYSAVAMLSVIWSVAPVVSFNGAFRLAMTTLIGIYIGARFGPLALFQLLYWVLVGAILLSILATLGGLDFALMANGASRGVFYHKNTLGSRSVLLLVVSITLLLDGRWPVRALFGCVCAAVALVLSESATSLVGAVAVVGGTFCLLLRGDIMLVAYRLSSSAAMLTLITMVIVWLDIDPVTTTLELLGRDVSLTGRTLLWDAALGSFWERPIQGVGFDAFWGAAIDTRTLLVLSVMGYGINHFHNTYLDVIVQLGLVGLVTAVTMMIVWGWTALMFLTRSTGRIGAGPILFLIAGFVSTLAEMYFFVKHDISMILLVSFGVSMSLSLRSKTYLS